MFIKPLTLFEQPQSSASFINHKSLHHDDVRVHYQVIVYGTSMLNNIIINKNRATSVRFLRRNLLRRYPLGIALWCIPTRNSTGPLSSNSSGTPLLISRPLYIRVCMCVYCILMYARREVSKVLSCVFVCVCARIAYDACTRASTYI